MSSQVQSLSCVQLFETLWTAACQTSLSLLDLTQTLVHQVSDAIFFSSDAIQPSYPLLSSSPPTFNLFQHQDLFK